MTSCSVALVPRSSNPEAPNVHGTCHLRIHLHTCLNDLKFSSLHNSSPSCLFCLLGLPIPSLSLGLSEPLGLSLSLGLSHAFLR